MSYVTELGIDTILIILLLAALWMHAKFIDREHLSTIMSTYPFSTHVDELLRKRVSILPALIITAIYNFAGNVSIIGSINNDIYADIAIILLLTALTWWRYYNIWRATIRKKGSFSNAIVRDDTTHGIITFFTYVCIFYHLSEYVFRIIMGK